MLRKTPNIDLCPSHIHICKHTNIYTHTQCPLGMSSMDKSGQITISETQILGARMLVTGEHQRDQAIFL